ncbi:hypothetical protein B0D71_11615 [Pseudomonas laurylsulfativorans]|uniref:Uncharacterized protein n=1 Tax=Pseudomonas laurylsulfativorans TaxID=1943631 RepID=A0A2S3VR02_9PSED|nr:hypothetical protein B0D71_11615 [Pseudomonas laurylsulfativorans]
MSLQVGRRYGRTTGPVLWGQNEKTPPPDPPRANEVSDVFVVGGATAVGYLYRLLSEICANTRNRAAAIREQARSHKGVALNTNHLWERACSRRR